MNRPMNSMRQAVVFLLLTACGSDSFFIIPPVNGAAESEAAADGETNPDSDAADDSTSTPEVSKDVSSDTTLCTPAQNYTWTCSIPNQSPKPVNAPAQYCTDWGGIRPTPAECTTCKENYTCACLVAHSQTRPECCTDSGGNLHVSCF